MLKTPSISFVKVTERDDKNPVRNAHKCSFLRDFCRVFCLLLALASVAQSQIGPEQKYFLVKDLQNDWLVYDNGFQEYVPYVNEQHFDASAVHLLIDIESNRKYSLLVKAQKDTHLFLDASLRERLTEGQWRTFKIDSLYQVYRKPYLLLTLYGAVGIQDKNVLIAHQKTDTEKVIQVEDESFLNLRPLASSDFKDFFTLTFTLLFGFVSFMFGGFERPFRRMYSVMDMLQVEIMEQTFLVNKPFSRVSVSFLLILSFSIAFICFFCTSKGLNVFGSTNFIGQGQTLGGNIITFIEITLILLGIFVLKYIMLNLLGKVYHIESVTDVHFFKIVQSSLIFYTALLVMLLVASFYIIDWQPFIRPLIVWPCIVFYVFRTTLLYFSVLKSSNAKNLYLISYLCVAELIPLIIGVRYVLQQ